MLVAGADPTTGIGGPSSYVRAHSRAARLAGYKPHIFCLSRRDGLLDTEYGTVHRVRLRPGLDHLPGGTFRGHQLMWRQMVWRGPFLARAVAAFASRLRPPRLLHSFGLHGWQGAAAARRLRRQNIEVTAIVSAHDTLVRERRARLRAVSDGDGPLHRLAVAAERAITHRLMERVERRAYADARLILVNYDSMRSLLADRYGVGDRIRRLPCNSELAFLRKGGSSPALSVETSDADPPLIVSVSRQDRGNGLDVLIEALARVRASGVPFRACLVGTGPLLATHRRLVERLGLSGAVRVEGFVHDVYPYLEDAHVFVRPSLPDGSGFLSLVEALQAGAAVVASRVDGIAEDVVDGDSALLVEPGDPAALAAGLARMLVDADRRRRVALRGHAVFEARFSAEAFAGALRQVYEALGVTPDA